MGAGVQVLAVYKCYSKKQTIYNLKHAGRQIKVCWFVLASLQGAGHACSLARGYVHVRLYWSMESCACTGTCVRVLCVCVRACAQLGDGGGKGRSGRPMVWHAACGLQTVP